MNESLFSRKLMTKIGNKSIEPRENPITIFKSANANFGQTAIHYHTLRKRAINKTVYPQDAFSLPVLIEEKEINLFCSDNGRV